MLRRVFFCTYPHAIARKNQQFTELFTRCLLQIERHSARKFFVARLRIGGLRWRFWITFGFSQPRRFFEQALQGGKLLKEGFMRLDKQPLRIPVAYACWYALRHFALAAFGKAANLPKNATSAPNAKRPIRAVPEATVGGSLRVESDLFRFGWRDVSGTLHHRMAYRNMRVLRIRDLLVGCLRIALSTDS